MLNRGCYQTRASVPARFECPISCALDEYGRVTAYTPPVPLDVYAPGEYLVSMVLQMQC